MYWFREGTLINILPWLLVSAMWLVGGWLVATHAFRLERRERLIVGMGLGLVPYLWFVNVLGHGIPAGLTFTLAGIIVLLMGIAFAWKGERPLLDWKDLKVWRLLIIGLILAWVFTRIGEGIALFDDRKNLSIISTMAAGDIPPHFYMNSTFYFAYHYGFQLFGASLMRLGGLFPWSAFDLSKAVLGAYSILLAYVLGQRYTRSDLGGIILAVVMTFATGTRYLLLLLPPDILHRMDKLIVFTPWEAQFSQILLEGTQLELPFPFSIAYLNGIEAWPLFMSIQAGTSTLSVVCLLLVWLLVSRSSRRYSFIILGMLLSIWALAWESTYGLFMIGALTVTAYYWWKHRHLRPISQEVLALLLSIPIVILQGGTITETLRKEILGLGSTGVVAAEQIAAGFAIRWPPAIPSSHFKPLVLSSPLEALMGFLEFGPILLLAPWISIWAWRRFRQGDWAIGALIVSTWVGFMVPILFKYKTDRDIPRLMAHSFDTWTVLLVLMMWNYAGKWVRFLRQAGGVTLALQVFGGIVVAGTALIAAQGQILTNGFIEADAYISRDYWDALPPDSEVFDPFAWRATVLTGRLTRSAINSLKPLPEWEELRQHPSVENLNANGYDYVYIDESWWSEIPDDSKASLTSPCVKIMAEYQDDSGHVRRLIDITKCHP